jgi:hypothetical protein
MFLGLRIGQNSVRGAFEMEQFLNKGTVVIGGEVKHFWNGMPTSLSSLVTTCRSARTGQR